jgi:hypothetical protein
MRQQRPQLFRDGGTFYVNPTGPVRGKGKRNGSTNRLVKVLWLKGKYLVVRTSNVPKETFAKVARLLDFRLSRGRAIVPETMAPELAGSQIGTELAKQMY